MEGHGVRVDVVHGVGSLLLTVKGEVDISSAPVLDDALNVAAPNCAVVVDLGGVEFIDSTGLRVLAAHSSQFVNAGGSLVVRNPSHAVRRLLDVTCLDSLLGVGLAVEKRPELASLPFPQ